MSTNTLQGADDTKGIETPQAMTPEALESAQTESEKSILRTTQEIKSGIEWVLETPEELESQKSNLIWYLEHQSKQVWEIIEGGGSEEYVSALKEFQSYLQTTKEKLLSTISSEEKEQIAQPKSTGTGASNPNAYKANRAWKAKPSKRMF